MHLLIYHPCFQIKRFSGEGGFSMRHFMSRSVLFLIGVICIAGVALPTFAQAETLVESNLLCRIYLAYKVDQAAAQAWLPTPWKLASIPKGPFKDSNLWIILDDRFLNQDAEGKPTMGGTIRLLAPVVFGKNPQTGAFSSFVVPVYSPLDDPGRFKNNVKATVSRESTRKGTNFEPGAGTEVWKVQDSAGGILEFQMEYQMTAPKRVTKTIKPRSNVEPDLFHVFRDDYATFLVKSIPAGIDRVKNYKLNVTISELSKLFNGSEQLIGISVNPIYVRQQILP
jgi:hypothetical protein